MSLTVKAPPGHKIFHVFVVFMDDEENEPMDFPFNADDIADAKAQASLWFENNRHHFGPVASVTVREYIPGRLDTRTYQFLSQWADRVVNVYLNRDAEVLV